MHTSLNGAVAIITGAGGGIGTALARALVGEGATVFVIGRGRAKLESAISGLDLTRVRVLTADLTRIEDIQSIGSKVEQEFGRLDVLLHSAGLVSHASVEAGSVTDFDEQYAANLRAPYLLTQTTLPLLKRARGQIVFINSSAGLASRPNAGQYCATKHGLRALTDSIRAEVNGYGIRVLSIYPGRTATSSQASIYASTATEYRPELLLQPEDIASVVINAITLPQTAEVTDISIRPMQKSY
jgi:NADP-dependent 3-hydroxy acid dehydrogenase YdfG